MEKDGPGQREAARRVSGVMSLKRQEGMASNAQLEGVVADGAQMILPW